MELEFRPFNAEEELREQRELFSDSFPEAVGTSIESEAHYRWKFKQFPSETPSHEFAVWALQSRKMLGYYAALPFRYSIDGELYRCGMVCDVMTHSTARGKGIFTKIGRYATGELEQLGVDFTSGYPIRPEVIPGHLKVGWQIARQLPMYIKVLDSSPLLTHSLLKVCAPVSNLVFSLLSWGTRSRQRLSSKECFKLQEANEFIGGSDQAYKRFFETWAQENPVHLVKDKDFLTWRLNAPDTLYYALSFWSGDEIQGLAILRFTDLRGVPAVAILDLMILSASANRIGVLLREIEIFGRKKGAAVIALMASTSAARCYKIIRHGFLRTPFVFKLILKPLSERAKQHLMNKIELFNVMWIDSDDL